jgi:hypothetical protein
MGHKRHGNAQKSLKQAVWDHFELILGTLGTCDFSPFSPYFGCFFYLIGEKFKRVVG